MSSSLRILCTVSVAALTATPAFGQTPSPVETAPAQNAEAEAVAPASETVNADGQAIDDAQATDGGGAIVVTGSRIRRDNYSTPQNVDFLTRDDQILGGARTTAETLQSSTVTSGTTQLGSSFTGFQSPGGSGVNVVGLRGLGTERTLVLMNGRRLAPAGVGPQLVSADLNVLPTAAVQRIEILREGASSIYGSDAIAGVINIISDTKVDGLTLDGFVDVPTYADDARTYRLSATAGKTFARGHIMASIEYSRDEGMTFDSRKDWRCPRELAYVNGQEVGQGTPDNPSQLRCFPFERGTIGTARGYGLGYASYLVPDDFLGPDDGTEPDLIRSFLNRVTAGPGFMDIGAPPFVVDEYDLRPLTGSAILDNTYLSPMQKVTAFASGSYKLETLGDAELYGEALFSRRTTSQRGSTQYNPQDVPLDQRQMYGGSIFDFDYYVSSGGGVRYHNCADLYGEKCSPFFPTAWADAGFNYFGPFIMPTRTFKNSQRVNFFRAHGGIRGNLGLGDWRYDANMMISRTRSREKIETPLAENFYNTWQVVAAPAGTPEQFITRSIAGQTAPAGTAFTCAVNVTAGAYNGNQCVALNAFDPNVFYSGNIPQGWFDYVYTNSVDRTRYNQETLSIAFDGSLPFSLQGGAPKMAIGFEHRRDRLDDRPSPEKMSGELLDYGQANPTLGKDRVNEAFVELQLPFIQDKPGIDLFELNASARYTHYKSYGSQVTYQIGAQYAPIPAVRFRGNYGTNFRAPNLFELNANQIGFYPATLDPCGDFGALYSPGTVVYENCLAELTPILDNPSTPENEALDFFGNGSIPVTTVGGLGQLQAEKAKTWGLGVVFTAPRRFADFSFAIDYWNVRVNDQVNVFGNLILDFCYNDEDYPNNELCDLIGQNGVRRITDPTNPAVGQIVGFNNPYLNIATQLASGIDFDARYSTPLAGGRLTLNLQATRNLTQKTRYFPGDDLTNFNGDIGYPNAGAGPKWVGSLDARYTTANDITLRWGVDFVGPARDSSFNEVLLTADGGVCDPDTPGDCQIAEFDLKTGAYFNHTLSAQVLWKDVGQITFGVSNLFNAKPPTVSLHPDTTGNQPRIGNQLAYGPYDYRGRSLFLNVTRTFK